MTPAVVGCAVILLGLLPTAGIDAQSASDTLATGPVLTREAVVAAALKVSPDVAAASGVVRIAISGRRIAAGAFAPTVNAHSSASRSAGNILPLSTGLNPADAVNVYGAGLDASVELFTGGRRGADRRAAAAVQDAADAALVERRFAVTLQAKQAFFDVLRAQDEVRVAEARIRRGQEGLAAARHREEAGTTTRSDRLRSEIEVTTALQERLAAEADLTSARFALGRVVGVDGPTSASESDSVVVRPLGVPRDSIVALVARASPAVSTAEAQTRAAAAGIQAARSHYLPTIVALGTYDFVGRSYLLTGAGQPWSVGLALRYPLFDGFHREDANARAEVVADVSRSTFQDARRSARAQAEHALAALEVAEQRIALARQTVALAAEDLRVQDARYRVGAATILDRITSQVGLAAAEQALLTVRYDYAVARAELEALAGREF
jgi:outer membrane protein TolC